MQGRFSNGNPEYSNIDDGRFKYGNPYLFNNEIGGDTISDAGDIATAEAHGTAMMKGTIQSEA